MLRNPPWEEGSAGRRRRRAHGNTGEEERNEPLGSYTVRTATCRHRYVPTCSRSGHQTAAPCLTARSAFAPSGETERIFDSRRGLLKKSFKEKPVVAVPLWQEAMRLLEKQGLLHASLTGSLFYHGYKGWRPARESPGGLSGSGS